MEFEILASVHLYISGRDTDVEKISKAIERQPESWKERDIVSGNGVAYSEHRILYCLMEKAPVEIEEVYASLRSYIDRIGEEVNNLKKCIDQVWLVIRIYEDNFISISFDHQFLSQLARYGIGLTIENRSP